MRKLGRGCWQLVMKRINKHAHTHTHTHTEVICVCVGREGGKTVGRECVTIMAKRPIERRSDQNTLFDPKSVKVIGVKT